MFDFVDPLIGPIYIFQPFSDLLFVFNYVQVYSLC